MLVLGYMRESSAPRVVRPAPHDAGRPTLHAHNVQCAPPSTSRRRDSIELSNSRSAAARAQHCMPLLRHWPILPLAIAAILLPPAAWLLTLSLLCKCVSRACARVMTFAPDITAYGFAHVLRHAVTPV